jgi:heme-degrading monooxygenase HmoA
MFVSMTTISGGDENVVDTARMAAESMISWLREFDGYRGMVMYSSAESGGVRVLSFWETREDAERSARGRAQVRDAMIETTGVTLDSVELYEVVLDDRVE